MASSSHALTSLANSIASLDFACRTLEATNSTLETQTQDFKRLSNVLSSKRHFDLINENEVKAAKNYLNADIAPQFRELTICAEEAIAKDEQRLKTLQGKADQQQSRIEQLAQLHKLSNDDLNLLASSNRKQTPSSATSSGTSDTHLRRELNALQNQKAELQKRSAALEREIRILQGGDAR